MARWGARPLAGRPCAAGCRWAFFCTLRRGMWTVCLPTAWWRVCWPGTSTSSSYPPGTPDCPSCCWNSSSGWSRRWQNTYMYLMYPPPRPRPCAPWPGTPMGWWSGAGMPLSGRLAPWPGWTPGSFPGGTSCPSPTPLRMPQTRICGGWPGTSARRSRCSAPPARGSSWTPTTVIGSYPLPSGSSGSSRRPATPWGLPTTGCVPRMPSTSIMSGWKPTRPDIPSSPGTVSASFVRKTVSWSCPTCSAVCG